MSEGLGHSPQAPIILWNKEDLIDIRTKLGYLVDLESGCDSKLNKRWAWLQLDMDLRYNLIGSLELVMDKHSFL